MLFSHGESGDWSADQLYYDSTRVVIVFIVVIKFYVQTNIEAHVIIRLIL